MSQLSGRSGRPAAALRGAARWNASQQLLDDARRLHALGVADNNAGHPRGALRQFRRAIALLERPTEPAAAGGREEAREELIARLWISAAMSESELNGLDRGLAALEQARAHLGQPANPAVSVHLYGQLGAMLVRAGRLAEGLSNLDEAVGLLDYTEAGEACTILMNRGSAHLYRGDLDRARQDLTRAADQARRLGLGPDECKARHNLGYAEFLSGNLALALKTMDEALQLSSEVSMGIILLDRSRVLIEAGLYRDADEGLTEASALFASERLSQDVGEVELARAECALLEGETEAARRLAGSARNRFRRRQNDRWRRDAELVLLHADLAARRPGARLIGPALRLAAEFRAEGLDTQARTTQLVAAEALLRAGEHQHARQVAGEAGAVRAADPVSARLHTRLVRARLSIASDDPATARREIRTGLAELAAHQAKFGGIDLQTASAIHGRQLAELDLSMALADGRAAAVLAAIERGRATSSRLAPVRAPSDPVAAELLAELRQLVEGLRLTGSDAAASGRAGADRRRIAELQRILRARSWRTEGPGSPTKPARFGEIEAALAAADSVLVWYFTLDERLHAVVLVNGHSQIVQIAEARTVSEVLRRVRADLDVLANGYLPAAMLVAVTATLNRSLALLDELLLSPLGLPDRRLVVVPTGALGALPWTNLPSLRGRPVVVAPSASAWLSAQRAPARAVESVVVVAGPDLARSDEEVTGIGRCWPSAAVLDSAHGRRQQLMQALTSASLVHVAAHGQHQAENPLFSSIRMADGPVFAYELDQNARSAEHVVLSACELGRATIRPGDEALGLTSVLLRLGSRSVVSGVARVHDDVAAEVMIRYHGDLAAGTDSAQALATACTQVDMPAPFVCFGASW